MAKTRQHACLCVNINDAKYLALCIISIVLHVPCSVRHTTRELSSSRLCTNRPTHRIDTKTSNHFHRATPVGHVCEEIWTGFNHFQNRLG